MRWLKSLSQLSPSSRIEVALEDDVRDHLRQHETLPEGRTTQGFDTVRFAYTLAGKDVGLAPRANLSAVPDPTHPISFGVCSDNFDEMERQATGRPGIPRQRRGATVSYGFHDELPA